MKKSLLFSLAALACPATAQADEIFGGVYAHDVNTPLNLAGFETGVDFQLGWRGKRIGSWSAIGSPSPYLFGMVNSEGNTNYAAVGLSWKIGGRAYLRPGIGLGVHTGPKQMVFGDNRIDFGSRVLFQPELGIGYQVNERLSVEASLVHFSHGRVFGRQNPGTDNIGLRINYRLP